MMVVGMVVVVARKLVALELVADKLMVDSVMVVDRMVALELVGKLVALCLMVVAAGMEPLALSKHNHLVSMLLPVNDSTLQEQNNGFAMMFWHSLTRLLFLGYIDLVQHNLNHLSMVRMVVGLLSLVMVLDGRYNKHQSLVHSSNIHLVGLRKIHLGRRFSSHIVVHCHILVAPLEVNMLAH